MNSQALISQARLIYFIAFLLLWNTPVFSATDAPRDPQEFFFNESFGDYSEELVTAKEQGKKAVLVFFEQDECPFCHRLKTTILNRPDIQEYFRERFLLLSHDIEGDLEMVDFTGRHTTQKDFAVKIHRVRATPVIAFFDLQGKRIVRYIGAPVSSKEFMWLADYVADGHYKKTSFTRYKREKKKAGKKAS